MKNVQDVEDILVDEACRGELGSETMAKYFLETALVMIEALLAFIVDTPDVDDYGASIKHCRISGTDEIYVSGQ